MFILKIAGIVLILAIIVILALASGKPAVFRVERSATIKADAVRIFALINDLKSWGLWSPWEKKDPNLKREFSANTIGVGASYEWWGNKDVGHGRMEILESVPSSRIVIKLDFISPFEAHNTAEFTLTSKDGATHVHWVMHGPNTFMGKVMSVFMDMDKMVGPDFEAGLAGLRAQTEK